MLLWMATVLLVVRVVLQFGFLVCYLLYLLFLRLVFDRATILPIERLFFFVCRCHGIQRCVRMDV